MEKENETEKFYTIILKDEYEQLEAQCKYWKDSYEKLKRDMREERKSMVSFIRCLLDLVEEKQR